MGDREYRKPDGKYFVPSRGNEELYNAEAQRSQVIRLCASLLSDIREWDDRQHWTHAVPQALFDTLESFEQGASECAASAFLEARGYTVTKGE